MRSSLARTGAVAALGFGLALAVQAPSLADTEQNKTDQDSTGTVTIQVNPSTHLKETDHVGVGGEGLDTGVTYYVQQCAIINEAEEWACDPNTRVEVEGDSGGGFSTPLIVHKKFTGVRGNGEYVPVRCGFLQCVVGVSKVSGAEATTAPISFD